MGHLDEIAYVLGLPKVEIRNSGAATWSSLTVSALRSSPASMRGAPCGQGLPGTRRAPSCIATRSGGRPESAASSTTIQCPARRHRHGDSPALRPCQRYGVRLTPRPSRRSAIVVEVPLPHAPPASAPSERPGFVQPKMAGFADSPAASSTARCQGAKGALARGVDAVLHPGRARWVRASAHLGMRVRRTIARTRGCWDRVLQAAHLPARSAPDTDVRPSCARRRHVPATNRRTQRRLRSRGIDPC